MATSFTRFHRFRSPSTDRAEIRTAAGRRWDEFARIAAIFGTFACGALVSLPSPLSAQENTDSVVAAPMADPSDYRVYRGDGTEASLEEIVRAAVEAEVLFLGETHNDRTGHALQYQIFEGVIGQTDRPVALSLEMFETDVQYIVDEYLAGIISEDHFRRSSRPWPEYQEDYRPVVELAKSHGLSVIAANAPRRYVNMVGRDGPDGLQRLSATAKALLPPLPYGRPSDAYLRELQGVMGNHGAPPEETEESGPPEPDPGTWAQALWDATMAHSVAQELIREPNAIVVHLAGSFHVRNRTGTPEHLERYRPGARDVIVVVDAVENVNEFSEEMRGLGDFVILTDPSGLRPSGN